MQVLFSAQVGENATECVKEDIPEIKGPVYNIILLYYFYCKAIDDCCKGYFKINCLPRSSVFDVSIRSVKKITEHKKKKAVNEFVKVRQYEYVVTWKLGAGYKKKDR